ncbi:MAG: transcription elongation factor [Salegentibacter sp.]
MTQKEQLFESCETYLNERIDRISAALKDLEADLENETKSSAGDKYETGREMINLEWNKLSVQLQQFRRLNETLEMAKSRPVTGSIQLGSLVQTSVANYFIAIPAGQVKLGEDIFFCIGANSPIAQVFLGKRQGDALNFNGKQLSILSVE